MLRAATVEVGSDRDHHAHASIRVGRRIDQRVDERGSLELVGARGEDLFELVDDDHECPHPPRSEAHATPSRYRRASRSHRPGPRGACARGVLPGVSGSRTTRRYPATRRSGGPGSARRAPSRTSRSPTDRRRRGARPTRRATSSATKRSRPKNRSASSTSKAASPLKVRRHRPAPAPRCRDEPVRGCAGDRRHSRRARSRPTGDRSARRLRVTPPPRAAGWSPRAPSRLPVDGSARARHRSIPATRERAGGVTDVQAGDLTDVVDAERTGAHHVVRPTVKESPELGRKRRVVDRRDERVGPGHAALRRSRSSIASGDGSTSSSTTSVGASPASTSAGSTGSTPSPNVVDEIRAPSRAAETASSASSRVFPIPGGPRMRSADPSPRRARRHAHRSRCTSRSRPTIGVVVSSPVGISVGPGRSVRPPRTGRRRLPGRRRRARRATREPGRRVPSSRIRRPHGRRAR